MTDTFKRILPKENAHSNNFFFNVKLTSISFILLIAFWLGQWMQLLIRIRTLSE